MLWDRQSPARAREREREREREKERKHLHNSHRCQRADLSNTWVKLQLHRHKMVQHMVFQYLPHRRIGPN